MKNDKITISDIAEALGVSVISVSRALSGQPGVSRELRDKVLETAKEMGYCKAKNSCVFNILVLHQKPYLSDNSNYSLMIQGIEKAIQKNGAEYQIEFVDNEIQEKMLLPRKLSKGNSFDGVIFIGRFNPEYINFLRRIITHQVLFTGYSPANDIDSVWFNFNHGGYKQCEYLIKQGHKKIGFIGNKHALRNKEKLLGITTALEDYQLPAIQSFFIYEDEGFEELVMELMNNNIKPTAFICHSDLTAVRLLKLLFIHGIHVPEDISVIGSGNAEMSALSIPALTTMDLNIDYSCESAVSLLLKRMGNPGKPFENITINTVLVERESVKKIL